MSQSLRPIIPTETNLMASARIRIVDGEVVKDGARSNYMHLVLPATETDKDGNAIPYVMEATLFDYYARYGLIDPKDSLFVRDA